MNRLRPTLLALALAMASTSAFAGNLTTTAGDGWTVNIENPSVRPNAFAGIPGDLSGEALATAIGKVYAERGALGIAVRYDEATRTVSVIEGRPVPTGPYASYWRGGEHLDKRSLETMAVNVSNRAKADGEHATVTVGAVQADGTVPVETASEEATGNRRISGALGFSNYGSRYSGPDVANVTAKAQLGDGNTLAVNGAHALSDLSDDSKHGQYDSAGLAFSHAGEYGVTAASVQGSHYRMGGDVRLFDLSGTLDQASISHTMPLSSTWSAYGILGWVRQTERLGVLDWDDRETYGYAGLGVRRQTDRTSFQVEVDKGIGGRRDARPLTLLGAFDPHYTKVTVDGSTWFPLTDAGADGLKLRLNAGGQWSSADAPTNEAFFLGGPGRGRAFLAGSQVGTKGGYGSAQLEQPFGAWTPYIGADTAIAKDVYGDTLHANSFFTGVRFQKPDSHLFFDAGYAHSFGARAEGLKGSRLFIQAGWTF